MRRRRRSPLSRVVWVLILAIIGLVIHGRITGQAITEGAVLAALFVGALIYEWRGRIGQRRLLSEIEPSPRTAHRQDPPEALGEAKSDELRDAG